MVMELLKAYNYTSREIMLRYSIYEIGQCYTPYKYIDMQWEGQMS